LVELNLPVCDSLLLHQRAQKFSRRSAAGKQRGYVAAETVHYSRNVDSAAASGVPGLAAAQLPVRRDVFSRCVCIDSRIKGNRYNVFHFVSGSSLSVGDKRLKLCQGDLITQIDILNGDEVNDFYSLCFSEFKVVLTAAFSD
jgi:hypothetical protein